MKKKTICAIAAAATIAIPAVIGGARGASTGESRRPSEAKMENLRAQIEAGTLCSLDAVEIANAYSTRAGATRGAARGAARGAGLGTVAVLTAAGANRVLKNRQKNAQQQSTMGGNTTPACATTYDASKEFGL